MEIKQLKLHGENIYPKVAIDSIVGEDGSSKVDTTVTENSDNLITSGAVYEAIQSGTGHSVAWENVTGKPEFANVATSGDYNDLIGKPIKVSFVFNDVDNHQLIFNGKASISYLVSNYKNEMRFGYIIYNDGVVEEVSSDLDFEMLLLAGYRHEQYVKQFRSENISSEVHYFMHICIPECVYTILMTIIIYPLILVINRALVRLERKQAKKFV